MSKGNKVSLCSAGFWKLDGPYSNAPVQKRPTAAAAAQSAVQRFYQQLQGDKSPAQPNQPMCSMQIHATDSGTKQGIINVTAVLAGNMLKVSCKRCF
jgi:hypothetical protein